MNDSPLSADIAAMIKSIEGLDDALACSSDAVVRFVVATDWADAAVPLALVKAFRAIIHPDLPVQLAFVVDHEPEMADAACVEVLAEGAGSVADLRGLEVLSFEQAVAAPYDSAVVPDGTADGMLTQVAGLIVRMHDIARRFDASGEADASLLSDVANLGDTDALRARLDAFAVRSSG